MKRFRKILTEDSVDFSTLSVGQSFTVDGNVWLVIRSTSVNDGRFVGNANAVRISSESTPRTPRFAWFVATAKVYNPNSYSLVHDSNL